MAGEKATGGAASRKRAKPTLIPLAGGADATFAAPAIPAFVSAAIPVIDKPVIDRTAHVPAEPAPVRSKPAHPIADTADAPEPIVPEPSMAEPVMMEPAPAEPVATPPSPPLEPALDATAAIAAPTQGSDDMATAFQPAAAETAEKAKVMFGDMNVRAKTAMEKSVKMGEELTELTKGNVEAVIQSSRVAAKGAEAIAQDAAEAMKKNFESATAAMKSFASVKSPTELFQLQSDAAKSYFDSAVADMSKFTEQMMKLAGDVAQPLSSRYALTMEKVKATSL